MLGKTAGGLFWMARYLERAENTARLVETGQRMALTRSQASASDWGSVMQSAAMFPGYTEIHGEVTKDAAIDWMLRAAENPASVRSSIRQARDNARLVRTALTYEVWAAVNGAFLRIDERLRRKVPDRDLPEVLELIKQHTGLVRGATHGTMMRTDIYDFIRLGTFVERADNTGRILDVKYYVLLPTAFAVGSSLDNVQWETILRSVGAGGGYRLTHGQTTKPVKIADFMILDGRMPRSLRFCCAKIRDNLAYLEDDYEMVSDSGKFARALSARLSDSTIEQVFEAGLHEYIQRFLRDLAALSAQIETDFRFTA